MKIIDYFTQPNVYKNQCVNCIHKRKESNGIVQCGVMGTKQVSELKEIEHCAAQQRKSRK